MSSLDPSYAKTRSEFHVGLEGSFGSHHVSPRSLTSSHLNHLVCLEGVVTKCSLVAPKVARSVHFCPATGRTTERTYTDMVRILLDISAHFWHILTQMKRKCTCIIIVELFPQLIFYSFVEVLVCLLLLQTSLEAFPSTAAYPTADEDGNPLQTEFGLSSYRDHQTLTVQELPERAPTGQLPRAVDVVCEDDLVDACKPGDRVKVVTHIVLKTN